MIDTLLGHCIVWFQQFPAEIPSFVTFLFCAIVILLACQFGFIGLCVYNVLAVIAGNIQVMVLGHYATSAEPVALGTVLFAMTFLVSDIITEHFGVRKARQSLLLCFCAQLIFTIWMILCLGHASISGDENATMYESMHRLFVPQARIFAASLLSFVLSQLVDISLYQWIRRLSHNRFLWLRQNVSTLCSNFLDNLVFSLLAWIVLNPKPMSFHSVLMTYVLTGYIIRAVINILGTPILYWSRLFLPKSILKLDLEQR